MKNIKCIMFDCMETIIDVKQLPDLKQYSSWAYYGSGKEEIWNDFDKFHIDFNSAREELKKIHEENKEHSLSERLEYMIAKKLLQIESEYKKDLLTSVLKNYWKNYKQNCYVNDSVKETLEYLSNKYKLGVVSNFIKIQGIEELLQEFDIRRYFEFVVTSVKIGYRKPHINIYNEAIKLSGIPKNQILFIGDDYKCDYEGPRALGIKTILLDKEKKYMNVEDRIDEICDIKYML